MVDDLESGSKAYSDARSIREKSPFNMAARREESETRYANASYVMIYTTDKVPGLAISGGVDSMALGRLCQQANEPGSAVADTLSRLSGSAFRASFTGFIVNHKLRTGGAEEARDVSTELARLGIESDILDLDWGCYGNPLSSSNVESIARRLRYQAIARACRERRITTLLLAHHRDDQAETVLMRILSNYRGSGLRGMRSEAAIPECAGIYGVDHSGDGFVNACNDRSETFANNIAIESGGVRIARPLLGIDKDQLVGLCKRDGVRWFEDPTNADRTMTVRNTIRWLLRTDDLPQALRKDRLLAIAAQKADEEVKRETKTGELFGRIPINLDTKSGEARFEIPQEVMSTTDSDPTVRAMLLRKMVATVTPSPTLSLQEIAAHTFRILIPLDTETGDPPAAVRRSQIAGADIHAYQSDSGPIEIEINRAMPTSREKVVLRTRLWPPPNASSAPTDGVSWPDWRLWDGRYWMRVLAPSDRTTARITAIWARFLEKNDVTNLRKSLSREELKELEGSFAGAKGVRRFTCPVIVAKQEDGSGEESEQVVALPSLGWSRKGWIRENSSKHADSSWRWEIRYRHVELNTYSPNQTP